MIDPKDLKKWLIVAAVIYLIFPRDLIPDFGFGAFGLIDDVVLMGVLSYWFRNYARKYMAQANPSARQERKSGGQPNPGARAKDSDPYAVLGISAKASQDEIQSAYRARMHEYHPDKVAHLGSDLQELAHRRSLEIQAAYKRLKR